MRRKLLCFLGVLLLTSCGFHLRGSQQAPILLKTITVESDTPAPQLEQSLKNLAVNRGIEITDNAPWVIRLSSVKREKFRQTSSVTAERDRFNLINEAAFLVIHRHEGHEDSYGPMTIRQETTFQNDETQASSKYNEELQILSELNDKTALAILRQTAFIANSPPDCAAHHENQGTATR